MKKNQYSGKVPLQIHHIDGNCLNNKEENLQLLCPNCHSLTETFGNLNKKSKRVYRNNKKGDQLSWQSAAFARLRSGVRLPYPPLEICRSSFNGRASDFYRVVSETNLGQNGRMTIQTSEALSTHVIRGLSVRVRPPAPMKREVNLSFFIP